MGWQIITLVCIVGAVALHLWWRSRLRAATEQHRRSFEQLQLQQNTAVEQIQLRQQAVFDSMVEGLLLLGADGRIEAANSAFGRLFEVSEDSRGKTILETVRVHEISGLVDALSREREVLQSELRLPGRMEKVLQVNAAAVFAANGERAGTVLVFHDVTRMKQLESARRDFVANVSHELRTPLSLIKGYVETLLDGAKDKPEVADKFLATIDRNADRLRLLLDDLLTISELESGRVELKLEAVPLPAVARKVINDFKRAAEAKHVSLREEVPALSAQADPLRLEQVLCNLVDNGIKYGRDGGRVVVGARALAEGMLELCVKDDGPGIPPESVERIFERFYRVDKGRSRSQGGTGLGLSIVKHIVQSHGGRAWAQSEPGRGASFYFTVPAAKSSSANA